MATNAVFGANLTKYNAGGSGDNIIADHNIKTVEKVWLDNYTLTSNITLTNTTISLAVLPVGALLTSVEVIIATSASQTSQTVALGWASEADAAAFGDIVSATIITHNATVSTVKFPTTGGLGAVVATAQDPGKIASFQFEATGTKTTVALKLNNWTATTGTIKSIVRYT